MASASTIKDIHDGQVVLDLECLERIYLNAYAPTLQVGGQLIYLFFTQSRHQPNRVAGVVPADG